jgi:hypothetical protein
MHDHRVEDGLCQWCRVHWWFPFAPSGLELKIDLTCKTGTWRDIHKSFWPEFCARRQHSGKMLRHVSCLFQTTACSLCVVLLIEWLWESFWLLCHHYHIWCESVCLCTVCVYGCVHLCIFVHYGCVCACVHAGVGVLACVFTQCFEIYIHGLMLYLFPGVFFFFLWF